MVPSGQPPNPKVTPLVRRLVLSCCSEQTAMDPQPQELGPFHVPVVVPMSVKAPVARIDAVHRDVVRAGIRYIGELSGRMDGYRGRRLLRQLSFLWALRPRSWR